MRRILLPISRVKKNHFSKLECKDMNHKENNIVRLEINKKYDLIIIIIIIVVVIILESVRHKCRRLKSSSNRRQ